jgi:hypothetical protein
MQPNLNYVFDYSFLGNSPESHYAIMQHTEKYLLRAIVSKLPDNSVIVEVGSALGGTACLMAEVNPTLTIHCMEAFQTNLNIWKSQRKHVLDFVLPLDENCNILPVNERHELFKNYIDRIDECFSNDISGKLAFKAITEKYPNIILHEGHSPENSLDWNQPIDLYFEDAAHINPYLQTNIDFWTKHIKPGGFIVGHDYAKVLSDGTKVDVAEEFNKLIAQDWDLVAKIDSLIILQKPIID